ncbi:inorganic diphosphatase [Hymenobacter sp. DG25B]|uniref:inorganic diphosphatase n=1 Tax=Hymenobacter sp. DG25B TaxID=1385664 RepID=UPI0009E58335|nr:inorganic diphosphatase [Hymenobacter sp. DG25B]
MSNWPNSAGKRLLSLMLLAGLLGAASSCGTDYANLPTFSAERKLLQVVVEVPAGTNHLQYFDPATQEFRAMHRAGLEQVVEYLPCPGNQGFIPGTRAAGSELPMQSLVLAETQAQGTIMEVLPLALLTLDDNGTLKNIVVTTPARPSQQILPKVESWQDLTRQYPSVREAVRQWYQHQGRAGEIRIVSWKDERAAEQAVKGAM